MSSPTYWLDSAPEIEWRDGVFVATFSSGEASFAFAMDMRICGILGVRATKAVQEHGARMAAVIRLDEAERAKHRRRK